MKLEYAVESLDSASTTTNVVDETLATSHSIKLEGLTSSATYYFVVQSTDESNNTSTSTEQSFTTLSEEVEEPDIVSPILSDIQADVFATSTVITWTTDEDSTSKITYATESLDIVTTTLSVIDGVLVTTHSLFLINLATSTQYYYMIESEDGSANVATSSEQIFTTTP